jgi:hypothetical protein
VQRILLVLMVALIMAAMMAVTASVAFGVAPGPGDKQCRGATGNANPHCPPPG